jgi:hypothetical protein
LEERKLRTLGGLGNAFGLIDHECARYADLACGNPLESPLR